MQSSPSKSWFVDYLKSFLVPLPDGTFSCRQVVGDWSMQVIQRDFNMLQMPGAFHIDIFSTSQTHQPCPIHMERPQVLETYWIFFKSTLDPSPSLTTQLQKRPYGLRLKSVSFCLSSCLVAATSNWYINKNCSHLLFKKEITRDLVKNSVIVDIHIWILSSLGMCLDSYQIFNLHLQQMQPHPCISMELFLHGRCWDLHCHCPRRICSHNIFLAATFSSK